MCSPFLRSNIFAPGYVSGPFSINFIKKSRFRSLTVTGLVIFLAILRGTPNCLIDKFGSPVMTERALKSTRLPIKLPRIRPFLELRRPMMHCKGRPDRCAIGAIPLILLFTIIATECCKIVNHPSTTFACVSGLFILSRNILLVLMILL